MSSSILLSVVVPNYNFERFLRELLSGLNSLKHRDRLEVIVADGGSTDGSCELASLLLLPQDQFLPGPDSGQADAIQKGLLHATGNWFIFQNSDDLFDLDALDSFLANPPATDNYDVVAFNQDVLVEGPEGWVRNRAFLHHGRIGWRQLFWSIYFTNQATIYNCSKAKEIGFDTTKSFAMDYDFVVRFFKKYSPSVLFVPRPLGMQRHHADTKTNTMQAVCEQETAHIKRIEFKLLDRVLGVLQAVVYHARKRIVAGPNPPFSNSSS